MMFILNFIPIFCLVKDLATQTVVLQCCLKNGLYVFPQDQVKFSKSFPTSGTSRHSSDSSSNNSCHSFVQKSAYIHDAKPSDVFELWHKRLGHPSAKIVHKVLSFCNIQSINKMSNTVCLACCYGKFHKFPFTPSDTVCTEPLQIVYSDLWCSSSMSSSSGSNYYISFVDVFSRFTWIYFLKRKSDALEVFKCFKNHVELQLGHQIKVLQTDWGGEFRPFKGFLSSLGIIHRHPCPHVHEQNGLVERKHRHIVENGLALLAQSSLPFRFWEEAFSTAVYLCNRLPTPVLSHKSPFEVLYNKRPDYLSLRVFGCACYPNIRPYNSQKLTYRSTKCTFFGYSDVHKGFKCLSPNGRVYIARDVIFYESCFPFADKSQPPNTSPNISPISFPICIPTLPICEESVPIHVVNEPIPTPPCVSDPTTSFASGPAPFLSPVQATDLQAQPPIPSIDGPTGTTDPVQHVSASLQSQPTQV